MEFLANFGLFAVKAVIIIAAVLIILAGILALLSKGKAKFKGKLVVIKINDKYDEMRDLIRAVVHEKPALKKLQRSEKKSKKATKKSKEPRKKIFVLDFHGDIRASAVKLLREEITAILTAATSKDEVVVRLESGGGMVHGYGLAASQLQRLRDNNIPLTIAIDKVAASGGYMMACVANKILSAPFAIIGSIGVVAQIPNFNRVLKKNHVDFEQVTAGEYKRTLTLFGENTEKGRQKFQEEIDDLHLLFKQFISKHRPVIDIDKVATGEHWHGQRALKYHLVDELVTSDDYLLSASKNKDIYSVRYVTKKTLSEKCVSGVKTCLHKVITLMQQEEQESRFF